MVYNIEVYSAMYVILYMQYYVCNTMYTILRVQ